MSASIRQILNIVNDIAPFEAAEAWDNVGLLAGRMDAQVGRVLVALDLTEEVLREAVANNVQLIVTHHPILFRGRKNLCEDDTEGRMLTALIRADIALIAAHTNYDLASGGVNAALCECLGVRDAQVAEDGMMRVGDIDEIPLAELAAFVQEKLGGVIRRYGDPRTKIRRVAVLGGAGGDYAASAIKAGADVFITGETGYHEALDSWAAGMCTLEAGHAATEMPGVHWLAKRLQEAADVVQYNLTIMESAIEPFL